MATSTTYIKDLVYPSIESTLSNKNNITKYRNIIGEYIDKNTDALSAIGPTQNILFTDYEKNQVYDLFKINPKAVNDARLKSKIKLTGANLADPFKMIIPVIIRYFSIAKNEEMVRLSCFFLGVSLYPSLYRKYWKFTPPDTKVMEYAINNMSYKYKIKQTGNLLNAIDEICYGAYLLYKEKGKDDLMSGTDKGIIEFVFSIHTRLNSFLKMISKAWYDAYQSGNYLEGEYESDEEDSFREAESSMYAIEKIVDNVSMKLVIQGPPMKLISLAAKTNKVSVNELRNYLNTMIVSERIKEIKAILESILYLYLYDNRNSTNDINTDKFFLYCIDTYKRSNTTDENINKIKKILDGWLTELDLYKKTQRLATINDFRRALYVFFVLSIQYYNK